MTTTTPTSGAADLLAMVSKALREAYNLGQRYWQQADSEYISQHKKADDTRAKFLALVEETCAALAAGQAAAAQPGVVYAELPVPNYPKSGGFPGTFAEAQMHAFADATCALRAPHGQAPAKPDPAYSAACHLATALFKKHFAHLPDFASGQAVWGLCGSTAGVILQIDNMVSGLVQPPTTSPQADSVLDDAARYRHLRDCNSGSLAVMQITGTDEDDWFILTEDDADAAIDAARAAQEDKSHE